MSSRVRSSYLPATSRERGPGPGDRGALPSFEVSDLAAALEQACALGGEIVHPGDRWAICWDSEGTPFGLAGPASTRAPGS